MWVLASPRPLSPDEWVGGIKWACTEEEPAGDPPRLAKLLDACEDLVVADHQLGLVRFAHLSVREFLELELELSSAQLAEFAALVCLRVLEYQDKAPNNIDDMTPFHRYAACHWFEYVKQYETVNQPSIKATDLLTRALGRFMGSSNVSSQAYSLWYGLSHLSGLEDYSGSPFHGELQFLMSRLPGPLQAAAFFEERGPC